MKISTRSEYGIRVLLALARAEDEEPLSLTSVAKSERLPHAYHPGPGGRLPARPSTGADQPGHRHPDSGRPAAGDAVRRRRER
jgi:hypothetical protein